MEHVMIDIETMGTKSFSSIISIGAVEFDIESGKTGRVFYCNVDLQSCIDAGLVMDADTVIWWMKQSELARSKLIDGGALKLKEALSRFSEFIKSDNKVWGNSARFDLGLLENAYSKLGMDVPWKFWNERDVRTLVSFHPDVNKNLAFEGIQHDALDDCKHQIKYCSEIWNRLNKS